MQGTSLSKGILGDVMAWMLRLTDLTCTDESLPRYVLVSVHEPLVVLRLVPQTEGDAVGTVLEAPDACVSLVRKVLLKEALQRQGAG